MPGDRGSKETLAEGRVKILSAGGALVFSPRTPGYAEKSIHQEQQASFVHAFVPDI